MNELVPALSRVLLDTGEPAFLALMLLILGLAWYAVRDMKKKLEELPKLELAAERMHVVLMLISADSGGRSIPAFEEFCDKSFKFDAAMVAKYYRRVDDDRLPQVVTLRRRAVDADIP